MKKTIVTIGLLFFIINTSFAQLGLKFGVHSFDIPSAKEIIFSNSNRIAFRDANIGFQAGIYAKFDISSIFIEPRIMFHSTKIQYSLNGDNTGILNQAATETLNRIDIPVLLGLNVLIFDVYLGPVAHLHLNSNSDLWDTKGYKSSFSEAEYGWRGGIGFGVGKINIGIEYEGNLLYFGEHITLGNQTFNFGSKPNRLLINIGIPIF